MFSPLDGSFREFLVDDDRFCAHAVRVCHFVQSRLAAEVKWSLPNGSCWELALLLLCGAFSGLGDKGVILDVRFCPSAGGLHLWDERGESLLAVGSIAAVADRPAERDFSGAAICNARFPNAGI